MRISCRPVWNTFACSAEQIGYTEISSGCLHSIDNVEAVARYLRFVMEVFGSYLRHWLYKLSQPSFEPSAIHWWAANRGVEAFYVELLRMCQTTSSDTLLCSSMTGMFALVVCCAETVSYCLAPFWQASNWYAGCLGFLFVSVFELHGFPLLHICVAFFFLNVWICVKDGWVLLLLVWTETAYSHLASSEKCFLLCTQMTALGCRTQRNEPWTVCNSNSLPPNLTSCRKADRGIVTFIDSEGDFIDNSDVVGAFLLATHLCLLPLRHCIPFLLVPSTVMAACKTTSFSLSVSCRPKYPGCI